MCLGNTVDGKATNYEYIFPWWVKEFSYQIVNNNNWLPEDGGNRITYSSGYGKEINSYFWYDSSSSYDVTQVVGNSFTINMKAMNINKIVDSKTIKDKVSIYDYYEVPSLTIDASTKVNNWYTDSSYKQEYKRTLVNDSFSIYGK